mmetsp:Transcript_77371/g.149444  ORF Transcript_77371/g.149444 Transcript_77371/m.149444 type:complete len:152 (-) Transcript_77371:16-471(-)
MPTVPLVKTVSFWREFELAGVQNMGALSVLHCRALVSCDAKPSADSSLKLPRRKAISSSKLLISRSLTRSQRFRVTAALPRLSPRQIMLARSLRPKLWMMMSEEYDQWRMKKYLCRNVVDQNPKHIVSFIPSNELMFVSCVFLNSCPECAR